MAQVYEDYWSITNAFTDYNGSKFLDTLRICIDFIDEFQEEEYSEIKYTRLQEKIEERLNINLISVRKAINQLVKLGFINPFLTSYFEDSILYIKATTNKKRQSLLSKIVYSNSSLNRSVKNESSSHQINFLIKTLIENSPLSKEDIIALMLVDIDSVRKGYLSREEINDYLVEANASDFIGRKYNQADHFINLIKKLDELVFVNNYLYFEEDAKNIFGSDIVTKPTKQRDMYLHRLYKNQLKEESNELFGGVKCMLEKLSYPVLIASHIKPFILSSDKEAYDPNNGLLLSRTIDSLFDLKYISFYDNGTIMFTDKVADDVVEFWKDYKLDNILLNDERKKYLEYHREMLV